MSLVECLDYLNTISGTNTAAYGANITVEALYKHANDLPASFHDRAILNPEFEFMIAAARSVGDRSELIARIKQEMENHNANAFLPLVTTANEANVAIALYAGDGIVMKITKNTELNGLRPMEGGYTAYPCVLPPISSVNIGEYVVEMFPWVNTFGIEESDVEKMRNILSEHNLMFHSKDDKPNNIGRMPNGELVVLDGNAVRVKDPSKPIPTKSINQWLDKVYSQFGPLYRAEDTAKLIGDNPDFSLSFSPLIQNRKPDMQHVGSVQEIANIPPGELSQQARSKFPWFGWGRRNNG